MAPPDDTLNLVGSTIADKYRVDAIVGEGGFAVVYRATHLIWNRPVAIKVFKSLRDVAEVDREKLLQDFIQEGALLAELSERSAAICQARDIGILSLATEKPTTVPRPTSKKDWVPYMVLEWLEGAPLENVLYDEKQRGVRPRTLEQTLRLLTPAAEALALAHRKGVAHRDIKPGNIFLLGDPRDDLCPVKLLDFGIAKVVQDAQKASGTFTKTSGQITSFTPSYGAPEQFSRSHGSTGPWTDVFAFALVIVECLTQKEPLEGDDYMQIAYASADKGNRPTPRGKGATVSDEIEEIFQKALAVSPNDRYRTMGDFWEALRKVLPSDSIRGLAVAEPVSARDGAGAAVPAEARKATPPRAPTDPVMSARTEVGPPPTMTTTTPGTVSQATQPSARRANLRAWLGVAAGAAVIAAGGAYFALRGGGSAAATRPPVTAASASATPSAAAAAPDASPMAAAAASCPDGMLYIPGGRFYMGSDDDHDLPQEKPAHNVTLDPYCIDRFEVSVQKYMACSDAGKCKRASKQNQWDKISKHDRDVYDPLCNARDPGGRGKHPINCVDWERANTYCQETDGERLPTEAEWEFAARGPDGRRFPWGDDDPTGGHLNACGLECVRWGKDHGVVLKPMYPQDDKWPNTAPVGTFPGGASRYGVEDVVGNVGEWVSDWSADYTKDALTNPVGPKTGKWRVVRGGAWNGSEVAWVRPTYRYMADPNLESHGIGFRCAKTLP